MAQPLKKTRCLFCSLLCPISLEPGSPDGARQAVMEYVADPVTQGRVCFRAHYVADLASHPLRLTEPYVREGEGPTPVSPEEGARTIGFRLGEAAEQSAVLVDGNLSIQDVAAAVRLAREVVGTEMVAVYLPESDRAMMRGLRPDAPFLALEDVAACDAFLVVGDPFGTHPVISRPVLEARASRRAQMFVLDCLPNRTSGFARGFLRVRPGGEAAALAALCRMLDRPVPAANAWAEGRSAADLAAMAGLEVSALQPVAEALSKAKQAAILLDPVPGRTVNVCAAASVASALATVVNRLMPMFRYGNAVGAARVAAALGARPPEEVLEAVLSDRAQLLLCLGLDVVRLASAGDGARLRAAVSTLGVASAMRNASTERADVVLPIGTWFESGGTVLDAAGHRYELTALVPPPGGAVAVRELCRRVASELDASLGEPGEVALGEAFLGQGASAGVQAEPAGKGIRLVARSDIADLDLGSPSRLLAWPVFLEPTAEIHMSVADARARGLAPRSAALIRADGRQARVTVRVVEDMPPGLAAVSCAFAETRALFRQAKSPAQAPELLPTEVEVVPEPAGAGN